MSSEQSRKKMFRNIGRDWPMYALAAIPVSGFIVSCGSVGYVISEWSNDDPIAVGVKKDALSVAVWGLITTIVWLGLIAL